MNGYDAVIVFCLSHISQKRLMELPFHNVRKILLNFCHLQVIACGNQNSVMLPFFHISFSEWTTDMMWIWRSLVQSVEIKSLDTTTVC